MIMESIFSFLSSYFSFSFLASVNLLLFLSHIGPKQSCKSDCKIFISNISLERSQEIAAFLHVYTGNYELIENYWGSCSQKWAWPPWSQDLNWLYLKKESTDFFLLAIQIQDIANNWVGMIKIECGSFKSWDSKICCIATMNG